MQIKPLRRLRPIQRAAVNGVFNGIVFTKPQRLYDRQGRGRTFTLLQRGNNALANVCRGQGARAVVNKNLLDCNFVNRQQPAANRIAALPAPGDDLHLMRPQMRPDGLVKQIAVVRMDDNNAVGNLWLLRQYQNAVGQYRFAGKVLILLGQNPARAGSASGGNDDGGNAQSDLFSLQRHRIAKAAWQRAALLSFRRSWASRG